MRVLYIVGIVQSESVEAARDLIPCRHGDVVEISIFLNACKQMSYKSVFVCNLLSCLM